MLNPSKQYGRQADAIHARFERRERVDLVELRSAIRLYHQARESEAQREREARAAAKRKALEKAQQARQEGDMGRMEAAGEELCLALIDAQEDGVIA